MVAIEGIDGSGKSVLGNILTTKRINDMPVYVTSEPTRSSIGLLLRQFLGSDPPIFNSRTAAFLFAADRNEHLYGSDGILHHLKNSYVFIDRYLFSSLAYQGIETESEAIWQLNASFPFPEYLVYLDIPIETACERMDQERLFADHFETSTLLKKIHAQYEAILTIVAKTNMNILRLDASQTPEELAQTVITALKNTEI